MRIRHYVLITFTASLLFTACSSVDKSERIQRTTPITVSVFTDDAVVTGDISPDTLRNFGKNISKQLISGLEDRGIMCESGAAVAPNKATVKVDLIGLQGESVFDAGPFGASTKSVFKVSYTATLTSAEGTRLFRFEGREASRVLDELPAEVGRYVAKRVGNNYQTEK
jgi:hypothetical protein